MLDIKVETTFKATLNHYVLELNCVDDTYSFNAYTESGSIEASFTNLSKEELTDIITFLGKGL